LQLSPVGPFNQDNAVKDGMIGQLLPNTIAKIIDVESGEILDATQEGVVGELCVKGPQVMRGYLNNDEATAKTIIDGWLHTGDIACGDCDGYFQISDRLKELIKVSGWQVAPAELEGVLLSHPLVKDAAVIGIDDEETGEAPKAFVVLKDDDLETAETEESLKLYVASERMSLRPT